MRMHEAQHRRTALWPSAPADVLVVLGFAVAFPIFGFNLETNKPSWT